MTIGRHLDCTGQTEVLFRDTHQPSISHMSCGHRDIYSSVNTGLTGCTRNNVLHNFAQAAVKPIGHRVDSKVADIAQIQAISPPETGPKGFPQYNIFV